MNDSEMKGLGKPKSAEWNKNCGFWEKISAWRLYRQRTHLSISRMEGFLPYMRMPTR